MSLYKRGGVFWSYVWVGGVRHARSTGTDKRRLAERLDREFKEELEGRKSQPAEFNPNMTFEELFARFVGDGAVKPYHLDRAKLLLPFFGKIALSEISKNDALRYRKARMAEKNLTHTTVNRDLEVLRHILYWAVDERIIFSNPLNRLRLERERRKRRPVMSPPEERRLVAASAPHLERIIATALDTGMRRGEILSQRWEDVDFPRRLLFVTHSKTPEGEAREIPLTQRMFNLLSKDTKSTGPVFTFRNQPLRRIKTAWNAALRRGGLNHYRFHDLRHTFNTRLMEAGVMQEVRKALMGHSSGEDVNSTYTHVELPAKRKAISKLEAWLASQANSDQDTTATKEKQIDERTGPRSGGADDSVERERRDLGGAASV